MNTYSRTSQRWTAALLALCLMLPLVAMSAAPTPALAAGQQKPGILSNMTTKKKVVLLAGAALLYYLYRKHQANAANKSAAGTVATGPQSNQQLYRSKNGGIYYRDAQGKAVWLTVPQQGAQVPAEEVQRYAPDYSRYRGPAPSAPRGYRSQPFSELEPVSMSVPGPGSNR